MIKLLTGESIPQTGTVWRHPALRIGYVAQHAFHHLEQHLEKTPMDYLQWRYSTGEDKEVLEKETRQWTDDEKAQMEKHIEINGDKRQIEVSKRGKLSKIDLLKLSCQSLDFVRSRQAQEDIPIRSQMEEPAPQTQHLDFPGETP
jgi:ATPase subunit of ABC transporter with duplicated ATPase domains